jgi:hypothetical protein
MNGSFREALRRGPDCPELDVLFSLAGEAPAASRVELERHVESCPACQSELSLYREFVAPEMRLGEQAAVDRIVAGMALPHGGAPRSAPVRWWNSFPRLAWTGSAALACAAILLTVGITIQRNVNRTIPGAISTEGSAMRSQSLSITSPLGELAHAPRSIAWEAVPGAAVYTVTLSEVDRAQIFYSTVTTPSLSLPPATVTLIAPGKTIFLEVEAKDGAGNVVATSGRQRIRVGVTGR